MTCRAFVVSPTVTIWSSKWAKRSTFNFLNSCRHFIHIFCSLYSFNTPFPETINAFLLSFSLHLNNFSVHCLNATGEPLCSHLSGVHFCHVKLHSPEMQSWKTDTVINLAAVIHCGWAAENRKQWQDDNEDKRQLMVRFFCGRQSAKRGQLQGRDQKQRKIIYF